MMITSWYGFGTERICMSAVSKTDGCFVCDMGTGIHCYGRQLCHSIVPWSSIQLPTLAASTMSLLLIQCLTVVCRCSNVKCCNKSNVQRPSCQDHVFWRLHDFLQSCNCSAHAEFRQRTRNFIQWLLFSYFALGRIRAEQKKYVFVQQAANCSSTRQECRGHYKCRLGVVIYLAISPGLHVRHLLV